MDYKYWDLYLAQGKHKAKTQERPIGSSATKRVVRLSDGSIGLKLHDTYCVTFHQDGSVEYDTGGWNTVTTRRFINDHGPVRVFTINGDLHLSHRVGTTPPRVQKCRRCHGAGTLPQECYGPGWCYPHWGSSEPCEHGQTTQHRRATCSHDQTESHPLDRVECWQCKATGRYDYGSNPMWLPWGGGPYRFQPDAPGVQITPPAPQWETQLLAVAPTAPSYSNSGAVLAAALPGLAQTVKAPCECIATKDGSPVQQMIIHLNDSHQWTREQIADWLETLDVDLRFGVPAE